MKTEEITKEITKEMLSDLLTHDNCYFAVEGVDCTGKGSITQDMEEKGLGIEGIKVKRIDFPQYEIPSGQMIKRFLNGDFGDYTRLMEPVSAMNPVEWHALVSSRLTRLIREINFVASIYSLNRIEFFKTFEPEKDTVYVFDRYMYSNMIHQLSNLFFYMNSGEGKDLLQINWRSSEDYGEIPFIEWSRDRILNNITDIYCNWIQYEIANGVPDAYTFMLQLDEMHILERLAKRKNTKHSGKDILETKDAIHRACMFTSHGMNKYHEDMGVSIISVTGFHNNNDLIREEIVNQYLVAVTNELDFDELPFFDKYKELSNEDDVDGNEGDDIED